MIESKKISSKKKIATHVPLPTLKRLPYYYDVLCKMEKDGHKYISSSLIATLLGLDDTQVRKDIASTGYMGRPKIGFDTSEFKNHLEKFLKMDQKTEAIIIGAGNLGVALAKYEGFKLYGLEISCLFDLNPNKTSENVLHQKILPVEKVKQYIKKNNISLAILAIPPEEAQQMTDTLVQAGIKALWNFTPLLLKVPEDVYVWNENLASSFLAVSQFIPDA